VPVRAHGTAQAAIFSKSQAGQYQRIVDWVHEVARAPSGSPPARVEAQDPWLLQAAAPSAPLPTPVSANPGDEEAKPRKAGSSPFDGPDSPPVDDGQRRLSDPGRGRYEPPHRSAPEHGEPQPGFVPADPFDPEIFNRRFFADKAGRS